MTKVKLHIDYSSEARLAEIDLAPEIEACLKAIVPEHDPRAVYRAMRKAMDEQDRALRRALH